MASRSSAQNNYQNVSYTSLASASASPKPANAHHARRRGVSRRNLFILLGSLVVILYLIFTRDTNPSALRRADRTLVGNFAELLATESSENTERDVHPILTLLKSARTYHTSLITQQSTSLSKATSQYKQRYGRSPPAHFSKWVQYAQQRNHTLIDEYDQLMRDLQPYTSLSPAALAQRTRTLGQLSGVSIVSIRDGKSEVHSKSGRWAPALAFQEMIADFEADLPDMDIAINERPEARVLPEAKRLEFDEDVEGETEEQKQKRLEDPLAEELPFPQVWKEDEPADSTWESFRRACPPDSAARRLSEQLRFADADDVERQRRLAAPGFFHRQFELQSNEAKKINTSRRIGSSPWTASTAPAFVSSRLDSRPGPPLHELQFQLTTDAYANVCRRPSLHSSHSAFYSNTRSIPHLYPLFSSSKPNGFADLLIPSHHDWSPSSDIAFDWAFKQGQSDKSADLPWSEKDNVLYWRGKVTQSAAAEEGHFQKSRLVLYANEKDDSSSSADGDDKDHANTAPPKTLLTLNSTEGSLSGVSTPVGELNKLVMDVAFSCDPKLGECQHLRNRGFRVDAPKQAKLQWQHKYLLDVDDVGASSKFLAMMESQSAVLKSTVHKEFWSNWVVPWYHFIPVSSSFKELHNIQSFFTGVPSELLQGKNATAVTPPTKSIMSVDPLAEPGTLFDGDKALQDIGMAGSRWKRRHVRREDMQVYVYRLLLEWSALLDRK